MKLSERSVYGQGIIASKQGKILKDNPYKNSKDLICGELKCEVWSSGFIHCENQKWGDIKKHGLYENLERGLNVPESY